MNRKKSEGWKEKEVWKHRKRLGVDFELYWKVTTGADEIEAVQRMDFCVPHFLHHIALFKIQNLDDEVFTLLNVATVSILAY